MNTKLGLLAPCNAVMPRPTTGAMSMAVAVLAGALVLAGCTEATSGAARRTMPAAGSQAPDLSSAIAPMPAHLKPKWQAIKAMAMWFNHYVVTVSRASKVALSLGLAPAAESLNLTEEAAGGTSHVYFGKMSADGKVFLANARFAVRSSGVRTKQYPRPQPLSAELSAQARAVLTIKADYERINGKGVLEKRAKAGIQMAHFVRRLSGGKIEAWLIAIPGDTRVAIVGTGQVWLLSADGGKVLRTHRLHRRTQVHVLKKGASPKPFSVQHHHGAYEGELPSPTDLLALAASPSLKAITVLGPRYAVIIDRVGNGGIRLSRLYYKSKLLRLLR